MGVRTPSVDYHGRGRPPVYRSHRRV